jgi:hypothetical protein
MRPVALDNAANFRVDLRDVIETGFNLLPDHFQFFGLQRLAMAEIQSPCPGNPPIMRFVPLCFTPAASSWRMRPSRPRVSRHSREWARDPRGG